MIKKLFKISLYGVWIVAGLVRTIYEVTHHCPECEKYGDGTRDVVDQASWESFPASDPPAY